MASRVTLVGALAVFAAAGCSSCRAAKVKSTGPVDPIWPAHLSINEQMAEVQAAGCSGLCSWNGFVDGYVIGTAPICEATCDAMCSGRACLDHIPGNAKSDFMPDAGNLCVNEVLDAAIDVFKARLAHRNETLKDLYKQIEFTSAGKACCCATRLPRKDSYEKKTQPTARGSTSCDTWCQYGGFGHGFIIGTAPACGATCENDCQGGVCSVANDFFSDYGAGCASGDKVCCCAQPAPPRSVMNDWKYTSEQLDPPSQLPSPFTCADLCQSGGFGNGQVIGTAPFCGASCSDCGSGKCFNVEEGDVTDYGNGCATGYKKCCCDTSGGSATGM